MQSIANRNVFLLVLAFVATLFIQMLILVQPAHAASIVWNGSGDGTTFADAGNWVGGVAPVADDDIALDTTGLADVTFDNDLGAGTQFGNLSLTGTGSGIFTLTGNDIVLTGGVTNSATYNQARFNVEIGIELNGNQDFTANAKLTIGASGGTNVLDLSTFILTKVGEYPLIINSDVSGSGGVTVSNGEFIADKAGNTVAVTVGNGGTLKGNGSVGVVTVQSGGTVAPGMSPGCLTTGNLTYNSGSTYTVEIDGATVCTGYDQTQVTGTVDLGGATLVIDKDSAYSPAVGTEFIIISNDGSDAVTGTFAGLAQGATTTVGGVEYTINYAGGDGNDVVLSATVVSAPDTGFGLISSNYLLVAFMTVIISAALVLTGRQLQKVKI